MELEIIKDYKMNIPLDMVAKQRGCSLHFVLKVLHFSSIGKDKEIKESKILLGEIR